MQTVISVPIFRNRSARKNSFTARLSPCSFYAAPGRVAVRACSAHRSYFLSCLGKSSVHSALKWEMKRSFPQKIPWWQEAGQGVTLFSLHPYHPPKLRDMNFNETNSCASHHWKIWDRIIRRRHTITWAVYHLRIVKQNKYK